GRVRLVRRAAELAEMHLGVVEGEAGVHQPAVRQPLAAAHFEAVEHAVVAGNVRLELRGRHLERRRVVGDGLAARRGGAVVCAGLAGDQLPATSVPFALSAISPGSATLLRFKSAQGNRTLVCDTGLIVPATPPLPT